MRYFIGIFVTIVLLIMLIVVLATGFGTNRKAVPTRSLSTYSSTDAVTRLTIGGQINAQSLHNTIIISVSRDEVVYEQQLGYDGNTVKTQTFANTENSYYAFLRALSTAGFNKGNTAKNLQNNVGVCPLGQRYNFDLVDGDNHVVQFWSTSCGTRTYGGNTNMTLTLFQAQVPDYTTLSSGVQL